MFKKRFNKIKILYIVLFFNHLLFAGDAISIDGLFEDWNQVDALYYDQVNDALNADYSTMKVTYDNEFLFIYFDFHNGEFLMQDWNEFHLYIDADNDSTTGNYVHGIGAELDWTFGDRSGLKYVNDQQYEIYQNDLTLRIAPTITSSEFEIAIARTSLPLTLDGTQELTEFKLILSEVNEGGDLMPSEPGGISFVIGEDLVLGPEGISLDKLSYNDIRLISYNTWNEGILDPDRELHFKRILQAIDPDIIALQEHGEWEYIDDIIQSWFPDEQWYASWTYRDLVVLSRFSIIHDAYMDSERTMAVLLDTEDELGNNLLIFNSHLSCCDNNESRQQQVDAFAGEWREWVISGTGPFEIDYATPFIHVGDFNYVGYKKQVETIRIGDIEDEEQYGPDFFPDWDSTAIIDLFSRHTHKRMGYTWRKDESSFNPGKLDYVFYSDATIDTAKHYILNTLAMDDMTLDYYGLQWNDTQEASDHLPIVFDMSTQDNVGVIDSDILPQSLRLYPNYPNPFNSQTQLKFKILIPTFLSMKIFDINGHEIKILFSGQKERGTYSLKWDGKDSNGIPVASGVYFILMKTEKMIKTQKIILLE